MGTITHKYRGVHDAELLEADLDLLKFIHIAVVEQGEPMHFQRSLGNTVTTDPGQWAEGFEEGTTLFGGLDQYTFSHPTESNEFVRKANELAVQVTGMTYQMLLERLETNGASEEEMMYAWDLDDQFYSGVWDYKPENVFTNRQGTWGDDNSEEILAAGGDPRRPGVRLRPDSRTVGVMDQSVLNQLDDSQVPMPEAGQFKRRGLDAIIPGSGLEWGLELGIGALLGSTSRMALKKWIDSLGNFVRKTGGGDDVLLGVTDDVMADMFSLSNRTNVQVHPSGAVAQIDQVEGTKFVEQFVKDHGRSPSDKEIIHWAQGKGNVSDNPIDIGPEGRVQKIKDNVVEMEIMGPADRVSEFGEYPADWDHLLSPEERAVRLKNYFDEAELEEIQRRIKAREAGEPNPKDYNTPEEYEDAMYDYAYQGDNPEGVGFREGTGPREVKFKLEEELGQPNPKDYSTLGEYEDAMIEWDLPENRAERSQPFNDPDFVDPYGEGTDPTIVEYRPKPEGKDYQTPEAYEDAIIAYNKRMEASNKTSQPKLEETRIQMREAPTIQAVTPGGREYWIGTGPISMRGEPTGRRVLGQAQGWGHAGDDSMPWLRIDFDENEALAERTIKKLDSLPQDKILFDVESGGVKEASSRGFKGGSYAQLDSLGYNSDTFHLLLHKQARDEGWTTLRSSDPETFLKLRRDRARQLKLDPGVPSPKKITMDTPLSPGEVELLSTFEHELAHLRFQHSYDFWTENFHVGTFAEPSPGQSGYAKAMAEIDAQRYMIDALQINPPAGGWPDWMWRGEYPRQIMDALPMNWRETHPMLGHGADKYYNPEYSSWADARLRRLETGGPTIRKEKNPRLGVVKDVTRPGEEYTIGKIKHPIKDFRLRDGDGNIRPRIFKQSELSGNTRASESAQRIMDHRAIMKTAPYGEASRIGTELASMATAGYFGYSGLGKKGIELGAEKYADGVDVMINVLAKVGDAVVSQAMEGAKYLKLNPGIGNQIFGMNSALSGANIIATPNDAHALDGIQGSLRKGGHNPQEIMPMDVIQDIKNGDAVVVGYESDADVDKAIEMGPRMGVEVSADLPHIWRKPRAKSMMPPKGEQANADHFKSFLMSQMLYPESRNP